MYEKATLTYAGQAKELVLGITVNGPDPDGRDFPYLFEFMDDEQFNDFNLA
jgi:hypothetical protein